VRSRGRQKSVFRSQYSEFRLLPSVIVFAVVLAAWVPVKAAELPLSEFEARFTPQETPVCMNYDVGYRLLNIELRRVAKVVATTTIGTWRHRVTGKNIPALFLDMRVDSPDTVTPGRRSRISIHDRIIAVLTVPDMQALLFAKHTDEYLRPLIHATESLGASVYDTQSGTLEFENRNLKTGVISSNLVNSAALFKLSHRIRPVMDFLVAQYKAPTPDAALSDNGRIVANLDGKVAALRILTHRERSPNCLTRRRFDSLCARTVIEKGSTARPRDFHAWSMTFAALARILHDEALLQSALHAPVETVVPLVMDYELALGSVRVTMTSIYLGKDCREPPQDSMVTESPEPVTEE